MAFLMVFVPQSAMNQQVEAGVLKYCRMNRNSKNIGSVVSFANHRGIFISTFWFNLRFIFKGHILTCVIYSKNAQNQFVIYCFYIRLFKWTTETTNAYKLLAY